MMNAHIVTPAPTNILQQSALLLRYKSSVWGGRKIDREASEKTTQDANAVTGSARVSKDLLPGQSTLAQIKAIDGALRRYIRDETLPWFQTGGAILPTTKYTKVLQHTKNVIAELERLVQTFVSEYDQAVNDAAREAVALGKLFNRDDYPSRFDIADKFAFEVSFDPIPLDGDFRVGLGKEQIEYLEAKAKANATRAANGAVQHSFEKVAQVTSRICEALSDYKPADKSAGTKVEGRFSQAIFDAAGDLADALPELNIMGNAELDEMADALRELATANAADLKKDVAARSELAEKTSKLASVAAARKSSQFFGDC